jgi:hypothetical protein
LSEKFIQRVDPDKVESLSNFRSKQ